MAYNTLDLRTALFSHDINVKLVAPRDVTLPVLIPENLQSL